jgi:hypothetical protein
MIAVIWRGAMLSETFSMACRSPYQALRSRTLNPGPLASVGAVAAGAVGGALTGGGPRSGS